LLFSEGPWQGLRPLSGGLEHDQLLIRVREAATFRPRSEAEEDSSWQQVIPYVTFRWRDRYLLTKRLAQSSERRLHHLYSVAVGGHVNPDDLGNAATAGDATTCPDPLLKGLWREWAEEVAYPAEVRLRPLGLLKDDSTPVGRVHVGLVGLMEGSSPEISLRETTKLEGRLLPLGQMIPFYLNMESWSQLLYDHLRSGTGDRS
jgi:predicted NUDIX family phosphoesterase